MGETPRLTAEKEVDLHIFAGKSPADFRF